MEHIEPRIQKNNPITTDNYWQFLGMQQNPFTLQNFDMMYYAFPRWEQYLDILQHHDQGSHSLLLLTAPTGSGKTTLLRQHLTQLKAQDRMTAHYLPATEQINMEELLVAITQGFGLPWPNDATLGEQFDTQLSHLCKTNRKHVLVIDDADQLPEDSFRYLLHIVLQQASQANISLYLLLAGDETLEPRLNKYIAQGECSADLVQILRMEPLSREDAEDLLQHRLLLAGFTGSSPFSPAIMQQIYQQSNFLPAQILLHAQQALLEMAKQQRANTMTNHDPDATTETTDEEAIESRSKTSQLLLQHRTKLIGGGVLAIILIGIVTTLTLQRAPATATNTSSSLTLPSQTSTAKSELNSFAKEKQTTIATGAMPTTEITRSVTEITKPAEVMTPSTAPMGTEATLPTKQQPPTPTIIQGSGIAAASVPAMPKPTPRNTSAKVIFDNGTVNKNVSTPTSETTNPTTTALMSVASESNPTSKIPANNSVTPYSTGVSSTSPTIEIKNPKNQALLQQTTLQLHPSKKTPSKPVGAPIPTKSEALSLKTASEKLTATPKKPESTQVASAPLLVGVPRHPTEQEAQLAREHRINSGAKLAINTTHANASRADVYTLQLIALASDAAAKQFIATHRLDANARITPISRNNQRLYVVAYGHYADKAAADMALQKLPSSVQKLKPWLRTTNSLAAEGR